MHTKPASRRRHSAEVKAKVLAACDEPGASVAAVAHAHGLNANLVHKWRRSLDIKSLSSVAGVKASEFVALPLAPAPSATGPAASCVTGMAELTAQPPAVNRTAADTASGFVPIQLQKPRAVPAEIRLELHRGAATVIVTWPADEAAACGCWLREWLG
jgi:transposase